MTPPRYVVPPLGSRILGTGAESVRRRRFRVQFLLTVALLTSNLVGATMTLTLAAFVVPGPQVLALSNWPVNFIAVPLYTTLMFIIGIVWTTRSGLRYLRWSIRGEQATAQNLRDTLALPWRLTVIQGTLWLSATALFTLLYGLRDANYIPPIAFTMLFAGTVTCATSFLFSEFALRPTAALALAAGPPSRRLRVGVTTRTILAWLAGTGVPVTGLMIIAIYGLAKDDFTAVDFAVPILALGGVILTVGLLLTVLVVSATVAPIRTVRGAMSRVERGDLDAEVVVFDGTELGELQSGFNRMADGLQERERIREIFGKHVGNKVAEAAMSQDFELGGHEVQVAVLFVDIIGSTTIAVDRAPTEVVTLLNRFFSVVVDEVDERGGLINKFEGDAALVIFGAPSPLPDPCAAALCAARSIMDRLDAEVPEIQAGLGVSYGTAVAGNIGARQRYEYTVIGDPVNEAARLSEHAKVVPGRVVVADAVLTGAGVDERRYWVDAGAVELRGRGRPTLLAVPASRSRVLD
ncbi:adenylate/guanylate cyclase domain-containing protein [Tomitella biformata]|uniref:adenylate/guanylate cyclase domain-containing protein n=1 Tax=Tomitella biformata TaxID=630403 RepID=UPI000463BF09|nr:adenylate/guanylate cyclase domain-containing protein [Tomitella biformata]